MVHSMNWFPFIFSMVFVRNLTALLKDVQCSLNIDHTWKIINHSRRSGGFYSSIGNYAKVMQARVAVTPSIMRVHTNLQQIF